MIDRTAEPIESLLRRYLATAERWAELRGDARAANQEFELNHRVFKALQVSAEGRSGIAGLMGHRVPEVRLLAATHSLTSSEEDAVRVLQELADGTGLTAVSAQQTLKAYRAGTLNLNW